MLYITWNVVVRKGVIVQQKKILIFRNYHDNKLKFIIFFSFVIIKPFYYDKSRKEQFLSHIDSTFYLHLVHFL